MEDVFTKSGLRVFLLRYTGPRCSWNTLTDSSNLSSLGGLEQPQSPCDPCGFQSFPLFTGAPDSVLQRQKERAGEMQRGVFFFHAFAAVTWHHHLLFGHGPLIASLPPLFHPCFPPPPPTLLSLQTRLPSLTGDLSAAAFCPHVASETQRRYTVISIRRSCLLICQAACRSACPSARLHACLAASVLPTAMPYSCPIHLVLDKRLLSWGHPSLCWPLYFVARHRSED